MYIKQETIILSPSNSGGSTASGAVVARLIGDFSTYKQIEDFDNEYLFLPTSPDSNERVKQYQRNAMLIPDSAISWSGDECDRIGTSYKAFKFQSNRCDRSQGDCLNYQLDDFHENGQFFLEQNYPNVIFAVSEGQLQLGFQSEVTQTSLVTLTLSTEHVRFVINRAHGYIESCYIPNFESLAESGNLNCTVVNDGQVEAKFRLTVLGCTNGILDVLEETQTIVNGQKSVFDFTIHSTNSEDSSHQCTVKLFDSLEVMIHNITVSFQSTQLQEDRGSQNGNSAGGGDSFWQSADPGTCVNFCDSLYVFVL